MATRKSARKSAAKKTSSRSRPRLGKDAKQQSALEQRTLAVDNQQEGARDATKTDPETTSSLPPDGPQEPGRVNSPSFDEAPVTGKRTRPIAHRGAAASGSIDEMPVGTTIEKHANEVRIRTAIAGGAVRFFSGPTEADARKQLDDFLRGEGPEFPASQAAVEAGNAGESTAAVEKTAKRSGRKSAAKKSSRKGRR